MLTESTSHGSGGGWTYQYGQGGGGRFPDNLQNLLWRYFGKLTAQVGDDGDDLKPGSWRKQFYVVDHLFLLVLEKIIAKNAKIKNSLVDN